MFDLRALDWDVGTLVDSPLDGARLFNRADPEDALPVPSPDETYAFSFTGTAANSKAEFSIKMQDAAAGAAPCDIHSTGLPSEQNKRKRSDGRKVSPWPLADQTAARQARGMSEVHGIALGVYWTAISLAVWLLVALLLPVRMLVAAVFRNNRRAAAKMEKARLLRVARGY